MGILGGSNNPKSEKCHELSRKSINTFLPTPPGGSRRGGGGFGGQHFKKCGKFHELQRKSIQKLFTPQGGDFRGQKKKKSGKCHEMPRKIIKVGGGGVRGDNLKVTKHQVLKSVSECSYPGRSRVIRGRVEGRDE